MASRRTNKKQETFSFLESGCLLVIISASATASFIVVITVLAIILNALGIDS